MAKMNNDKPLARLTEESKINVAEMKAELDRAEADLEALERLKLDVTAMRERVRWGREAVKVIEERLT